MTGFQNPYLNPYGFQQFQTPVFQPPAQQVTKVTGENGARAYQIGPNGSALLLDESGLMVWLVTSDGAGYKTVAAYDIAPHKTESVAQYDSLESRIKRLEDVVNEYTADTSAISRRDKNSAADPSDDQHDQRSQKPAAPPQPAYADKPADAAGYGNTQPVWRGRE